MPQAPEGYRAVEVTTGLSNDDYTEILSGLNEGDAIYRQTSTSSGNNMQMMFGGMGGNMRGGMSGMGGAPSGDAAWLQQKYKGNPFFEG